MKEKKPQRHSYYSYMVGEKFGRLTVKEILPKLNRYGQSIASAICDCGRKVEVRAFCIKGGYTKSCGCLISESTVRRNTTHGMARTRVYRSWQAMKERCESPKHKDFERYGGRGIKVCDRWREFEKFHKDMGEPPVGHTLDRIDTDANYSPENCRWANIYQQARNRSNNHVLDFQGKSMPIAAWAEATGLTAAAISTRLNRHKWSVEKALSTPARRKRQPNGKQA